MKREILVVTLLAGAAILLLPTLASPLGDNVDSELHEDIEMAPSDGPNSVYATFDENGEIAIKMTEENQEVADGFGGTAIFENSVTEVDAVFDIAYTGDEEARVWLSETEEPGVTFYRNDSPEDSIEQRANNVSLSPGEVVSVGILIDATEDDHGIEDISDFTINAEVEEEDEDDDDEPTTSPAPITDGELVPEFQSVTVNETGVSVNALVENAGQTIDNDTVSLSVNDEEIATHTTELAGGEDELVSFDEALSLSAGEEVRLVLESSTNMAEMNATVEPDGDDETESDSERMLNASFEDVSATPDGVDVSAIVENPYNQTINESAILALDGDQIASESLSVGGNETESLSFDQETSLEAGDEIDSTLFGEQERFETIEETVVVEEPAPAESGDEGDEGDSADEEGEEEESADEEEESDAETDESEGEEAGSEPDEGGLGETVGEFSPATLLLLILGLIIGTAGAAIIRQKFAA